MKMILTIKEALGGGYFTKGKHWAKILKRVDRTKTNGYCFEGDFIPDDRPIELPVGTILLDFHEGGSRKYPDAIVRLAKVTPTGLDLLDTWRVDMTSWALRIRDQVGDLFDAAQVNDPEKAILDEIVSLEARIAELKAKLRTMEESK